MHQKIILFTFLLLTTSKVLCQNLILKIHGNTDQETHIIDSLSYYSIHTDYKSVLNELNTLSKILNSEGYIAHTIKDTEKINDSTVISSLNLNKKYTYIYIRYNDAHLDAPILNSANITSDGNFIVLPFKDTETSLQRLNSKLAEQGLPFSTLKLENINIENDSVKADLKISEKTIERHIDKIIVKGYEKFPRKYIKYYAQIKTGDIFNMNEIIKKTKRLNKLPFTNLIRDAEVLFTKDSTTLYIYLEKQKSNNFDGYLGFTTNEDTNKLEFSGYLNMLLRNNLNYGESIKLVYESDENDQKTFNINIDAPYLFKSPIGTNVDLNIFKKDSSFTTVNQSIKLYYQINTEQKAYLGVTSVNSNKLIDDPSTLLVDDYKSTFFETKYNYIHLDEESLLFPIKTYGDITLGIGTRLYDDTKENQKQFDFELAHIFYLNEKNSIYSRFTAAGLQSNNYLENELLRFGGINSIRGFDENSLTANLYTVLNLEYRLQLNPTIYIHSITDFSYFENLLAGQKEKLIGLGVGFAVLTKAGLLKLNFANGKSENQTYTISNAKIHISLTTLF
ncbi:hypothetical protein [Formosa sp. PL04]|uniref:hypothetical protein n=1 Tax=Formosa sp. PL04 TaxID=3081755 RepID=UPI0029814BF1|nr:hypothetical protein [Formosa sp. PL04]MDW5287773.1 hypothetical protein [Formosa sp. PL04]